MDSFLTPSHVFDTQTTIKNSRFIAACSPVIGKAQAKAFIAARASQYPDANHHCWAMVAGPPWDVHQQDQSDDGEPRGSAGKPMLNVLTHSEFGQIVVVITRFFGGQKLGVGGLVRAYSHGVVNLLDSVQSRRIVPCVGWQLRLPYSLLASLEHRLHIMECEVESKEFGVDVQMMVRVPLNGQGLLTEHLQELGHGSINVHVCEEHTNLDK